MKINPLNIYNKQQNNISQVNVQKSPNSIFAQNLDDYKPIEVTNLSDDDKENQNKETPNGLFDGVFYQGNLKDCWLLNCLIAVRRYLSEVDVSILDAEQKKKYDKIKSAFESVVTIDPETQTADVTLYYDGKKEIYSIPSAEYNSSKYDEYSSGDRDVRILEIAMTQYEQAHNIDAELSKTQFVSSIYYSGTTIEGFKRVLNLDTERLSVDNIKDIRPGDITTTVSKMCTFPSSDNLLAGIDPNTGEPATINPNHTYKVVIKPETQNGKTVSYYYMTDLDNPGEEIKIPYRSVKDFENSVDYVTVEGKRIYGNHSYSVSLVGKNKVKLQEPHDSEEEIIIKMKNYKKYFSALYKV